MRPGQLWHVSHPGNTFNEWPRELEVVLEVVDHLLMSPADQHTPVQRKGEDRGDWTLRSSGASHPLYCLLSPPGVLGPNGYRWHPTAFSECFQGRGSPGWKSETRLRDCPNYFPLSHPGLVSGSSLHASVSSSGKWAHCSQLCSSRRLSRPEGTQRGLESAFL